MFNGHPQALINLSLCAMTIVKWPVNTFNCLNFNCLFEFWIQILNKNVDPEFWTWI